MRARIFARKLWIEEYAPSMMDVIVDILKPGKPKKSRRQFPKIRSGKKIVLDLLKQGKKQRRDILQFTRETGISDSSVDNEIITDPIDESLIERDKYGWYCFGEQ